MSWVQTESDNFHRADASPLSGSWATIGTTDWQIVGNVAEQANLAGLISGEKNTAMTWPDDQYSEITVGTLTGGAVFVGAGVRMNPTGNFYGFVGIAGTNTAYIQRYSGGGGTTLTSTTVTINPGDVMRLEIRGTTLTAYLNGTVVMTTTDATYATGNPGIAGFNNTAVADGTITLWAGGIWSTPSAQMPVVCIMQ